MLDLTQSTTANCCAHKAIGVSVTTDATTESCPERGMFSWPSPPLPPLVLLQTWLPGMQAAASAGLASAVSTRMGKVNQTTGTPTPTPPFSPGANSAARFSLSTPALSGKQECVSFYFSHVVVFQISPVFPARFYLWMPTRSLGKLFRCLAAERFYNICSLPSGGEHRESCSSN